MTARSCARGGAAILAIAALPACMAGTEVTFDPCAPTPIVAPGASTEEVAAIEDAIAAWAAVFPIELTVAAEAPESGPVLVIRFESEDSFYRAVYWDDLGEIAISRTALSAAEWPIAIAHEMGHAFGLPHIDDAERVSVMNVGNLAVWPNPADGAAIADRWSGCR